MNDNPRVLIIAPHGSYRTAPFIQAAHRLKADVLIASEGKHSVVSEYAQGLHIRISDQQAALEQILAVASQRPFAGIIATDDATTELAALASQQLGLPHNNPAAVRIARRKDLARVCLQQAGVSVPQFVKLDLRQPFKEQIQDLHFPIVVKPLALSASRGVIRVDSPAQLAPVCKRIQNIVQAESDLEEETYTHLLLEEFIPGKEVAVEGMLYDGQLNLLAVFDKPEPLNGPYFEETYYITPSHFDAAQQEKMRQQIQAACTAYGLREGPVHAECRINEEGVWILEVAARTIGGLCGKLLRFGTGYSLEELVLSHAMGQDITQDLEFEAEKGAAGVMMIPIPTAGLLKRVEGLLAAQRVPHIIDIDIQVRPGHELIPLPEGGSYLGFIFARGADPQVVETALRAAHGCLNIVTAPIWKAQVA